MPKPALVLLHGALGAGSQLEPLARTLTDACDVHLLDFEGHGNRPANRPFRMWPFAENVMELLDRKGIASAVLFGYSMGGYVALTLALHEPQRVASVVTLGTKFRWDPATAAKESSRLNPDVIRTKVPQFADTLSARHAGAGGWELVLSRTAEMLRYLGDHPGLTDATLAQITRPVQVIVGDRDNTVSVEESRGAAETLARGTLTVMENTPHPIEQVDVVKLASLLLRPVE